MKNSMLVITVLIVLFPVYSSAVPIEVVSATYGKNCGVSSGNVTHYVSSACDGKASCSYNVNHKNIGDPANGCAKDFIVRYTCGIKRLETTVSPEASGKNIRLKCDDSKTQRLGGHSHNGRVHNHPLPKQGVKHRHGNGAYGVVRYYKTSSENKVEKKINHLSSFLKRHGINKDDWRSIKVRHKIDYYTKTDKSLNEDAEYIIFEKRYGSDARGYLKKDVEVYLYGDFKDGRLLSQEGSLKVDVSRCINPANGWGCGTANHAGYNQKVGFNSSNLKEKIDFTVAKLISMTEKKAVERGGYSSPGSSYVLRKSRSSSSSSSYATCYSSDKCHEVIKKGYYKDSWIIRCIKGPDTGKEGKICVDKDGDWSYGCTIGTYNNSSARIAGNKFCK